MGDAAEIGVPKDQEDDTIVRLLMCLVTALAVLEAGSCAYAESADGDKAWKIGARAGLRYDDNVNTAQIDNTSGSGDYAGLLDLSGVYKTSAGYSVNVEFGYDFSQSLYMDLDAFDLQSHTASIYAAREVGGHDVSLFYGYTRTLLGRNDFLSFNNFQPMIGHSLTDTVYVSGAYNYQNKNFISINDRDSDVHAGSVDVFVFFNESKSFVKIGYRLERENTKNSEFDYLGQAFTAELKSPIVIFNLKPKLRLAYDFKYKDYRSITADIGAERLDKRHAAALSLAFPLNKYVDLETDIEYIRALSNVDSSDFVERIATLALKLSY